MGIIEQRKGSFQKGARWGCLEVVYHIQLRGGYEDLLCQGLGGSQEERKWVLSHSSALLPAGLPGYMETLSPTSAVVPACGWFLPASFAPETRSRGFSGRLSDVPLDRTGSVAAACSAQSRVCRSVPFQKGTPVEETGCSLACSERCCGLSHEFSNLEPILPEV